MSTGDCSNPKAPDTTGCFSFGTRLGLTFIAQMATVSAILVTGLLIVILVKGIRNSRRNNGQWPPHIFLYLVSLLAADLIQAIGAVMDIRWIHMPHVANCSSDQGFFNQGVQEGAFCTTQGVLKQVGDVGVALASLAIAFQTWSIVAMRWPPPKSPTRALIVIGLIWAFIAVLNGIGLGIHHTKNGPLYGNTVLWCSNLHTDLIIAIEYLWLWFSAVVSIALYLHVAIVLYREHQSPESVSIVEGDIEKNAAAAENRKLALQMLFYPVIYLVCIAPQSVVRLITFFHGKHYDPPNAPFPIAASTFAAVVFGSSGALNVFLYTFTRPSLVSGEEEDPGSADDKDGSGAELNGHTTSLEMNQQHMQQRSSKLGYQFEEFDPYNRPVSSHVGDTSLGGLPD